MDISYIILVISIVSAVPLLVIGYLIAIKQKLNLINGVDFSKLSDTSAFARILGHSITLTGVLMIVISMLLYMGIINLISYGVILMVFGTLPLQGLFFAMRRYSKEQ